MGRFSGTDGVGILWFKREDYGRYLAIVADPDNVPASFREWQERANEAIAFVEAEGGRPIRVEVTPEKLAAWCALRGLRVDSNGRNAFAADPANWPTSIKH
jgi:hypothetical protein